MTNGPRSRRTAPAALARPAPPSRARRTRRGRLLAVVVPAFATPALVALPVTTPPWQAPAPRPVPPVVQQQALRGVDAAALARPDAVAPATAAEEPQRDAAAATVPPAGRGVPAPVVLTPERTVRPFALVGLTWQVGTAARGTEVAVRVRTRGTWTGWTALEQTERDGASPEALRGEIRDGTAPLLTAGGSDGVQVRVTSPSGRAPRGLRLELVDPGTSPADARPDGYRPAAAASAEGALPGIYSRAAWGADERMRDAAPTYMSGVRALVVHHTASTNSYTSTTTPAQIRAIYAYAVRSEGYSDIPYNFLVDKYGRLWEGRAGGMDRAVRSGATGGFNDYTTSVSALGNFHEGRPSSAVVSAISRLAAWKLGVHRLDPRGYTRLVARGGAGTTSKYPDGTVVTFPTIFGHRDSGYTACPGQYLYPWIPIIRSQAASLTGAAVFTPSVPASVAYGSASGVTFSARTPGPQYYRVEVYSTCSNLPIAVLTGQSAGNVIGARWSLRTPSGSWAWPGNYRAVLTSWSSARSAVPWQASFAIAPTSTSPPVGCPVTRVGGADFYETVARVAAYVPTTTRTVVVVGGTAANRLDAAVAAPLARQLGAPVLASGRDAMPASVAETVRARGTTTAVLVGGTAALGTAVESQLRGLGVTTVRRVAGANAVETAAAAAGALPTAPRVLLISSTYTTSLYDGLAAGAAAAATGAGHLLSYRDSMAPQIGSTIDRYGVREVVVVGSKAAVSDRVVSALRARGVSVTRVDGGSATGTAAALADWVVASGGIGRASIVSFTAEGIGAPALGRPLLVSGVSTLSPATESWLARHGPFPGAPTAMLHGGPSAFTDAVFQRAGALAR